MKYNILFFVCIVILSCICYSQENPKDITDKDSTSNLSLIVKEELQFKNFFRDNYKKFISNDELSGLKIYGKAINDSLFTINLYSLNFNDYSKEELAYFKDSFNQLIDLAKKNHYKYDLGDVGRYLGISRKILAILLAIISVVK